MLSQEVLKRQKYLVLGIAGQSNAVGYDESIVDESYTNLEDERIMQLGFYGEDNLNIIPLGVCAQNYQDLRPYSHPYNKVPNIGTKGLHLPLASLLLEYLPVDYKILIIPAAYGGTGFTMGELGSYDKENLKPQAGIVRWGVASPYYKALKDRISYVLDLNEANQFLGMIWIQGENDNENEMQHKVEFEKMTEDFFGYFNKYYADRTKAGKWDRDIWYNIETVSYWYTDKNCKAIWDNYRTWNPKTYVEIPRDTDSNEINGTGLTASIKGAHYGNNAYLKVLAPKIVEKMRLNHFLI